MRHKALARRCAAEAVLGLRGVDPSRIHVDERNEVYVDQTALSGRDLARVVLLSLELGAWLGYGDCDAPSVMAADNPIYADDFRWLVEQFGGSHNRIGEILQDFLNRAGERVLAGVA